MIENQQVIGPYYEEPKPAQDPDREYEEARDRQILTGYDAFGNFHPVAEGHCAADTR